MSWDIISERKLSILHNVPTFKKRRNIYVRLAFFFSQIFTFCLRIVEKEGKTQLSGPQDQVSIFI